VQALPGTTINLNQGLWANNTKNHNAGDGAAWAGTFNGLGTWSSAASAGFVAPAAPNYNYHLRSDSAAKEKAIGSTTSNDIDGDARPFDAVADLGADEYGYRLNVQPNNAALWLDWQASDRRLAGGVKRYEIVVTCPPGGSPPAQGRCGAAIDAGVRTTFTLTGLSNHKTYGIAVTARDAGGKAVGVTTANDAPTNRLVFMPLNARAAP
jgi:hypothetical protein